MVFSHILLHIEDFEEEFVTGFVILFLVYVENLVLLVLKFYLKSVETANSVLLLNQVG